MGFSGTGHFQSWNLIGSITIWTAGCSDIPVLGKATLVSVGNGGYFEQQEWHVSTNSACRIPLCTSYPHTHSHNMKNYQHCGEGMNDTVQIIHHHWPKHGGVTATMFIVLEQPSSGTKRHVCATTSNSRTPMCMCFANKCRHSCA